jgi:hypothetical protein
MNHYMAIVIGGVLGGCAAPAGPPAGTQFDGAYAGQNTLIRGGGYLCGAPSYSERLTVRGGRFDYPFAVNPPRTVPLPVQIAADGTVAAQMQYGTEDYGPRSRPRTAWVTVTGRVDGGMLAATIDDYRCTRRLMVRMG